MLVLISIQVLSLLSKRFNFLLICKNSLYSETVNPNRFVANHVCQIHQLLLGYVFINKHFKLKCIFLCESPPHHILQGFKSSSSPYDYSSVFTVSFPHHVILQFIV